MLKITIGYFESQQLFLKNPDLYEQLISMDKTKFIEFPTDRWVYDENKKPKNDGYGQFKFYVNELNSLHNDLWQFCKIEPLESLEMMGGASINSKNVFEAAKRNQIMLPNNLMLDMKELHVEINACTNSINELLKEGWKLIAVLPQHQQARPDYILGKTEI